MHTRLGKTKKRSAQRSEKNEALFLFIFLYLKVTVFQFLGPVSSFVCFGGVSSDVFGFLSHVNKPLLLR